jgi:hypothetical protein
VPITIRTGVPVWDELPSFVESCLKQDRSAFVFQGQTISGYRSPDTCPIWLRDHTHQQKGFKYFERDMQSAMNVFLRLQREDGSFVDFVDAEGNSPRCENESDVEYLAVECVYGIWQGTGDDDWMAASLPLLAQGLQYEITDPHRWDPGHRLVKRPPTIDTWDFAQLAAQGADPPWYCIMFGDNTGMARACRQLASLYRYVGHTDEADHWDDVSHGFAERVRGLCWNGRHFIHRLHLEPHGDPIIDERNTLSLSNAHSLNRGVLSLQEGRRVIETYLERRKSTEAFAEWFSIDPCFPAGSFGTGPGWGNVPGEYVNGGIMPLVGGELAHAAFTHGYEWYGVDILRRYWDLVADSRETYLWYRPDGTPGKSSASTLPTDGWGSAAMLYALVEGLCGIEDLDRLYRIVSCSPRWPAAAVMSAEVEVSYAAGGAKFEYAIEYRGKSIVIGFMGTGKKVRFRVLLPDKFGRIAVHHDGVPIESRTSCVAQSRYAEFESEIKETRETVVIEEMPWDL